MHSNKNGYHSNKFNNDECQQIFFNKGEKYNLKVFIRSTFDTLIFNYFQNKQNTILQTLKQQTKLVSMKKLLLTFFVMLSSLLTYSQLPPFQWANKIGGTSEDIGYSIATDAAGNSYATGYYSGNIDFDPGSGVFMQNSGSDRELFLTKIDASGNFQWAKTLSGGGSIGNSLKIDALGNFIICGNFNGTVDFDPGVASYTLTENSPWNAMFVLKLDPNGNFIWAHSFEGFHQSNANAIAVDPFGNSYTTGYFEDSVDFDPGVNVVKLYATFFDIFILKLDPAGNFKWVKQFGGYQASEEASSIAVDSIGNVYTTGQINGTCDFDPGAGVYAVNSVFANNKNIFISKLDSAGNFVWAKPFGPQSGGTAEGMYIALDKTGNIYTTGDFNATTDFDPDTNSTYIMSTIWNNPDAFILKLSNDGDFLWAKQVSGKLEDYGASIAIDDSGNVYNAGYYRDSANFDLGISNYTIIAYSNGITTIYVSKFDALGNFVWVAPICGANNLSKGCDVTVDNYFNVHLTGQFVNSNDFDPSAGVFNISSNGMHDIFIYAMGGSAVGLSETSMQSDMLVYPNPFREEIRLKGTSVNGTIRIFDILGKEQLFTKANNAETIIHTSTLNTGYYFVKYVEGKNQYSCKLIKF